MKNSIKITISALILALAAVGSSSAQLRSAYFMPGSVQRYDLNPALSPLRGYIAIPATNLTIEGGTNYLRADNLFLPNAENNGLVTFMHKSVGADDFLSGMPDMNVIDMNVNDRILGMGSYTRHGFWSVGINMRSETTVNLPKDFFAFLKTMESNTYNISGLGVEHNDFLEVSGGYTFPVRDAFTVGVRVKALFGLAHAAVNIDKMTVKMGEDEYRAEMSGTFEANVQGYDFSSLTGEVTFDEFVDYATDFKKNFGTDKIGSIGFAVDAGVDWQLLDRQINISASVTDLGYNIWSENNSYCASVENIAYAYKGFDFATSTVDFEKPENITLQSAAPKSQRTSLHAKFNLGFEYTTFNDKLGLGALYQGKAYADYFSSQVMLALSYRPARWFSASLTQSFIDNSLGVLGAALNIHSSGINFFLGTDYIAFKYGSLKNGAIPIPLNQNKFNLTLGLSIPLRSRSF